MTSSIPSATPRFGTMLAELASPNVGRLIARAGFGFAIVDCEHGPFNRETVAAIIAGSAGCLDVIVRVPGVDRAAITSFLDMGADGILVPMVSTPQDAELVVAYSKYAPLGHRGVSTVRAHTGYGVADLAGYQRQANEHVSTWVQIETLTAVRDVRSIAAVPGIDAVIVGPSDLGADAVQAGLDRSATLLDAIPAVAATAAEAGIHSGIITTDATLLSAGAEAGMTIFGIGSELNFVLSGGKSFLATAKNACHVD